MPTLKQFFDHIKHRVGVKLPGLRNWWRSAKKTFQEYSDDRKFMESHRGEQMPPMPPRFLRYRVSGHYDIAVFHKAGPVFRQCIETALASVGRDLSSFNTILDFGVGCSKLMRWMDDVGERANLYGCDIDAEAIRWNKSHIPFAKFSVNKPLPPLDYPDEMFDLIYGISVLTHLNEEYQDQWLQELKRVSKPGAILLLTTHGEVAWTRFIDSLAKHPAVETYKDMYNKQGFLFYEDDRWRGAFPDFYQTMFHDKRYVLRHWAQYLEILDIIDAGLKSHQDIVILTRKT